MRKEIVLVGAAEPFRNLRIIAVCEDSHVATVAFAARKSRGQYTSSFSLVLSGGLLNAKRLGGSLLMATAPTPFPFPSPHLILANKRGENPRLSRNSERASDEGWFVSRGMPMWTFFRRGHAQVW